MNKYRTYVWENVLPVILGLICGLEVLYMGDKSPKNKEKKKKKSEKKAIPPLS